VRCGPGDPILLPQIIEQRKARFQFFDVLAHDAVLPLEASVGDCCQHFQTRMVGGEIFSEPQGPENLQNRSQPGQRPSLVIGGIATRQPVSHAGERLVEKGKSRLGAVQAMGPAAKCGRIGHAIRICERRRCLFPGAVLHQAPPQCLTARQQTVVRVRERKQRREGKGSLATGAAAATNVNPIVMLIMRLLRRRPWPMIESISHAGHLRRITSAQLAAQSVSSLCGGAESGIKRIVAHWSSAPPVLTCQDLSRRRSSFLLKQKSNWKRITLLDCSF
jgi:hypothetical protein